MPRRTITSVRVNPNLRCLRVYPTEACTKPLAELKTTGFRLTRDQARELATALLLAAQDWEDLEVTAHRFDRRKSDGSARLTVTSSSR